MLLTCFRDGFKRTVSAPAILIGVFVLTIAMAFPLALTLRGMLGDHLGQSLAANEAADAVNYDWWQEFAAQAAGLGTTFTPSIIGFAAVLENIGGVMDARSRIAPVTGALIAYVIVWTFLAGGILDRYARRRPIRANGFFAACGVFFFRFLRLAVIAGLAYWLLFAYLHHWLFDLWYPVLTRDLAVERTAFFWRLAMYALFAAALVFVNVLLDYTKIRAVVEDRRSMVVAFMASARFVVRHPRHVFGLYALNALAFLAIVALWAFVAPGAGGAGISMWLGLIAAQVYVIARLFVKLQFLASQTALFQASLAHAGYTAVPEPVWPESPAAEAIGP